MTQESLIPNPEPTETPAEEPAENKTPEPNEEPKGDDEYKYAGKFGSVDDLEKGYKELSAKVREKAPTAPEEYELNLGEVESLADYKTQLEGLDLNDNTLIQAALPAFKKHNISQDAANEIIADVLAADLSEMINPEEELKKLGPEGGELIKELSAFKAKFPAEEQGFLDQIATTAEGVKFLAKLRDMTGEKAIPTEQDSVAAQDPQELITEAKALKAKTPNFEVDKGAQARYEKLMDDAARLQLKQK